MDTKIISELIAQAKKDPKFFHALIFEPEKVLGTLDHLDRQSRGNIVATSVEEIFSRLLGVAECGNTCTSSCDNTCGGSCGFTTNIVAEAEREVEVSAFFSVHRGQLEGCGNTCTSSCDNTCGQSCGFTTNLQDQAQFAQRAQSAWRARPSRGIEEAGCGNTCTSSCDNTCGQSCGFTTNFTDKFGGGNIS